jgi:predicted  nucleic acid-binding Zn-ribbon protein
MKDAKIDAILDTAETALGKMQEEIDALKEELELCKDTLAAKNETIRSNVRGIEFLEKELSAFKKKNAEIPDNSAEIDALNKELETLKKSRAYWEREAFRMVDKYNAEVRSIANDRRERIATAAMQGLLSDPNMKEFTPELAVEMADALIQVLEVKQ